MVVLLKLLLAHIISDFFFQCDKICKGKQSKNKEKFAYHYLHGLIHALMAYLFVADWSNWIIPSAVFISHTIVDYIKIEYLKKNITSFIIDQAIHLSFIVLLWLILLHNGELLFPELSKIDWNSVSLWTLAVAYLSILKPTSILLNLFINRWASKEFGEKSLPNAGKWIGYFERILIMTLILTGNSEGIGFLLAAKSIFRFGELNKAQEIRTTEYVLIGTFSSFTVAIIIGFLALYVINCFNA